MLIRTCFDTGGPPQILNIRTSKIDIRITLIDSFATRIANTIYRSIHLGGMTFVEGINSYEYRQSNK